MRLTRELLEELYLRYNRRQYVHPDPLEFLYGYPDPLDREIVGLIASSLAYGNVKVILRSVEKALEPLGDRPSMTLRSAPCEELRERYRNFKHRFTTGDELAGVLCGVRRVLEKHGSLGALVERLHRSSIVDTQSALVKEILGAAGLERSTLLPDPSKGSAAKRLNLYFRWMVRHDDVDPGGWNLPPSELMVPLDTHMHAFALSHGITRRRGADLRTVVEVTGFFRAMVPEDPVRYDFIITRPGISGLAVF